MSRCLSIALLEGDPYSGYTVARMRYEIILAPEAIEDLRRLRANIRSAVRDALETHLRYTPTKTSKSRIKRLRGLSRPQFRLRVGDVRVFYDVTEAAVEILAIVPKSQAATWLEQTGEANEGNSPL
jgi:mRNA interferase RelE/StbE